MHFEYASYATKCKNSLNLEEKAQQASEGVIWNILKTVQF